MSISDLEQQLRFAKQRRAKASAAVGPKTTGREWEEYLAADADLLRLERELAAAKHEPYAVPVDFPVEWDIGAPLPHLLVNDSRCFLSFYARVPRPGWDGTTITRIDPADSEPVPLALVEFQRCASAKLGGPNDEVMQGHPLAGKGMHSYSAQEVVNSPWIAELEAINSVHEYYDHARWRRLRHFVFWFHDSTFECVAESFEVELRNESMSDLLAEICRRLVSYE